MTGGHGQLDWVRAGSWGGQEQLVLRWPLRWASWLAAPTLKLGTGGRADGDGGLWIVDWGSLDSGLDWGEQLELVAWAGESLNHLDGSMLSHPAEPAMLCPYQKYGVPDGHNHLSRQQRYLIHIT